jgi:hypothetical protein
MAEIVLLRRSGTGRPLSDALRGRYQARLAKLDAKAALADGDFYQE